MLLISYIFSLIYLVFIAVVIIIWTVIREFGFVILIFCSSAGCCVLSVLLLGISSIMLILAVIATFHLISLLSLSHCASAS